MSITNNVVPATSTALLSPTPTPTPTPSSTTRAEVVSTVPAVTSDSRGTTVNPNPTTHYPPATTNLPTDLTTDLPTNSPTSSFTTTIEQLPVPSSSTTTEQLPDHTYTGSSTTTDQLPGPLGNDSTGLIIGFVVTLLLVITIAILTVVIVVTIMKRRQMKDAVLNDGRNSTALSNPSYQEGK